MKNLTKSKINQLAYEIVNCAIEVHSTFGPGLLESIYEECMESELTSRNFKVKRQYSIPVYYKGKEVKNKLRIDLLVNESVIVELKAIEAILPIHKAQLITYMKLAKIPKGLIINFNVPNITKYGLIPIVNEYFEKLPKFE